MFANVSTFKFEVSWLSKTIVDEREQKRNKKETKNILEEKTRSILNINSQDDLDEPRLIFVGLQLI